MDDTSDARDKLLVFVGFGAVGSPATACKQPRRQSIVSWHFWLPQEGGLMKAGKSICS